MDHELARSFFGAVAVGIGATAIMDLWAATQKRLFAVPSLDYRLVGRWIGHFPRGRFRHDGSVKLPRLLARRLLAGPHTILSASCSPAS